jgi:acetamidase/formamidase
MIGTIGVAPTRPVLEGSCSIDGQGPWGGNFDCRDLCKGTRLYLPVYHEGGLLYVGDVHGTQGDTEFTGVADETRAEVTLSVNVIKNKKIPFARLEKADSIVQLNCFRPLEDAVTQAFLWLMQWLVDDYGFDKREAYLQMTLNPYVRVNIYQMVKVGRIQYTVGVEFPKKYL